MGAKRSEVMVLIAAVIALFVIAASGCMCPSRTCGLPDESTTAVTEKSKKAEEVTYEERRQEVIEWLESQDAYTNHVKKVVAHAKTLNGTLETPADAQVVEIGALMHDCGYAIGIGPRKDVRKLHAELGGAAAKGLLPTIEFGPEFTDHISRIVDAHHSVTKMDTPEWRVVWMADLAVNKKVKVTDETADEALEELRGMLQARREKQNGSGQS